MKKKGVFIITGGTGGLGVALAQAALNEGFPIALIARSGANLKKIKLQLKRQYKESASISVHSLDLRNEQLVRKEISKIYDEYGEVRALINNAGTWMGTTNISTMTANKIRDSLDLNFFSAFNATMSLIQNSKTKFNGDLSIINIGATASVDAWLEVLPFCLAKGALKYFTRALARELGPKGIHVAHCVIDGMLDTKRTRKLNKTLNKNRFINTTSLSKNIIHVALQGQSCWTAEWDVRPFNETW